MNADLSLVHHALKGAVGQWTNRQTTIRNEDCPLIAHKPIGEMDGYELFEFREDPDGERKKSG